MKLYQSKSNPNLFFWVECVTNPQEIFMIMKGIKGYNPTDAHDGWFWEQKDAENLAQELAQNS